MLMPFTKWITIPWMVWTISVRSASAFVRIRSSTMFSNPRILPSSSKYRIAHLNVKWCDNKGCLIFSSRLRMLLLYTLFHFIQLFFVFRYVLLLPSNLTVIFRMLRIKLLNLICPDTDKPANYLGNAANILFHVNLSFLTDKS